jgi:hypothetical protein
MITETPATIPDTADMADMAAAIISAEVMAGSGTPVILNQIELGAEGITMVRARTASARNDTEDPSWLRVAYMVLDGGRPSRLSGWMSPVSLVITQAAAGAGHWAAGRRQRALAEWVGAAGFGLVAWGLGTEAPTRAEVEENIRRQQGDLMRKLGSVAPATVGTEVPVAPWLSRYSRGLELVSPVASTVIGVPWRLRHPRRLTVLAIASEAPNVVHGVLRTARAVQLRRPRMAVGSALIAAGSVARLRAASAEPVR